MNAKSCTKCNKEKPLDDFYSKNYYCKSCMSIIQKKYRQKNKEKIKNRNYRHYKNNKERLNRDALIRRRTKHGLIGHIYNNQTKSSRKRGYQEPEYSLEELRSFITGSALFEYLYKNWVDSDYDKWLTPSIDRIDDYKGYNLNNIQLMTWKDNHKKGINDKRNGINNKQSKSVAQYSMDGMLIKIYCSASSAARNIGASQGNISAVCNGIRKHTKGFKWAYV